MSSSEAIARYRVYAADCVEAAQSSESDRKFAFLMMAMAWLGLADQVEKTSVAASPALAPSPEEKTEISVASAETATVHDPDLAPGMAS